jgi:hypothetical protein
VVLGVVDQDVDLAAISAAASRTFFESVTSSGSSVTCGKLCSSSKPANFLPGLGWPTQMMSAPPSRALSPGLAEAVLPSVTSTLRCFGSQVNSRNCRSSAIRAFLCREGGDHRLPGAVEHRAHAHALLDGFMQMGHHRRPAVELDQTETPRQRSRKNRSLL